MNRLTGSIPDSLGALSKLGVLYVYYNKLSGQPLPIIGNITSLINLNIAGNNFTGSIPESFGNLVQLHSWVMGWNSFSGPLPKSIGNMKTLRQISINGNQFSGGIPSSIGTLSKLLILELFSNKFSGLIPSELGTMPVLRQLLLHGNQFTGVPMSLSGIKLERLTLLPNPMSMIPYDLQAQNPVSTLNALNLTNFLNIPISMKRQTSSNAATLTTSQLLTSCSLNSLSKSKDILLGCMAGIVYFCQSKKDWSNCRYYYDTVFANSFYAPIGKTCPAWKSGPRSIACAKAVSQFRRKYGLL